jgi:acyl-CoA ligase (AMP-forming) (exosortase A-associated)
MSSPRLLHELVLSTAERQPQAIAVSDDRGSQTYERLQTQVERVAAALVAAGMARGSRVGIYLDKRAAFVEAAFGVTAAGCVMVPVNPGLKPEQVLHIANDCKLRLLVTSPERLAALMPVLGQMQSLTDVVTTEAAQRPPGWPVAVHLHAWPTWLQTDARPRHRSIDADIAAILYTSGSTGRPKGVVLSHRNMVAGAQSVSSYLDNGPHDTLLAALPLSFDAGFSQLTTAFYSGARVVLLNYLLPQDVLKTMQRECVTGLTAVPPLFIQLAQLDWSVGIKEHLRYFANTGGRLPRQTLDLLRQRVPQAKPFLMYGLTEAFRSTYLPPEEVDRRPDSIGKAIPNAEILVLREDGTECEVDEPGELVHRGALVAQGYWGDAEKTAERFRPLPAGLCGREASLQLPEMAVFSGDTVRRDREGFLYFVGRRDEMIKTSGYRVSPTEVEEVLYASGLVGECVAFGVEHAVLGQSIQVLATAPDGTAAVDAAALLSECRKRMPSYMVPQGVEPVAGPLPRNPNGKIDRKLLATVWSEQQKPGTES